MSTRWPVTHVYRSTATDLVEALLTAQAKRDSFAADCDTWAADNPFDETKRDYQVRYNGVTLDQWFAGFEHSPGDDTVYRRKVADAPHPGWKFNRRIGCWVPDRRAEEGKALARSMPYVKGAATIAEKITGLTTMIIVGATRDGGYSCTSAEITLTEGVVTAACPGDPLSRQGIGRSGSKFSDYWAPVKLSDFYAEQGL